MTPKQILQNLFSLAGFKVSRLSTKNVNGRFLWNDLRVIIPNSSPICFDVGANAGQTLDNLLENFGSPIIHAFEPSTSQFQALNSRDFGKSVTLHHCALGSERKEAEFINYRSSDMSSFLTLDPSKENRFRDINEVSREMIRIDTVDHFLDTHNIQKLDLLKTDTQGFDLEVLKGARKSFERGAIQNCANRNQLYQNVFRTSFAHKHFRFSNRTRFSAR